jgi:hypothetical protein
MRPRKGEKSESKSRNRNRKIGHASAGNLWVVKDGDVVYAAIETPGPFSMDSGAELE